MTTEPLFHEIVEAHGRAVLAVCASMLGPGPDAEDAWQETFVAALRHYPLKDVANVEAWLVRTASRRCLDVLRVRRRTEPMDTDDLTTLLEGAGASHLDEGHALDEYLVHLTARQRYVIAQRYGARAPYDEIAADLRCTPAAARRCGSDAMAVLRRRFGRDAAGRDEDDALPRPSRSRGSR